MLFLFRGKNGPVVRGIVGALLIVFGFVLAHGALFVGIGIVLLAWGVLGVLSSLRVRHRNHAGQGGDVA